MALIASGSGRPARPDGGLAGDYPTREATGVRDYIHCECDLQRHVQALFCGSSTSEVSGISILGTGQAIRTGY